MSEYTPTTEQVRQFWASDGNFQPAAKSYDYYESLLEFDRWLAAHDRETARKAWDEGYDRAVATHCDADDCDISGANPYTETAGE
jgi:hypothetical protein